MKNSEPSHESDVSRKKLSREGSSRQKSSSRNKLNRVSSSKDGLVNNTQKLNMSKSGAGGLGLSLHKVESHESVKSLVSNVSQFKQTITVLTKGADPISGGKLVLNLTEPLLAHRGQN